MRVGRQLWKTDVPCKKKKTKKHKKLYMPGHLEQLLFFDTSVKKLATEPWSVWLSWLKHFPVH